MKICILFFIYIGLAVRVSAQDAAPIYRQLASRLSAFESSSDGSAIEALIGPRMPTQIMLADAKSAELRHADIFRALHRAATSTFYTLPPLKRGEPFFGGDPNYAVLRAAVRLITGYSVLLVSDGNPIQAINEQSLGFLIAKQAMLGKSDLSYLVSVAIYDLTLTGMGKLLQIVGHYWEIVSAIERSLLAFPPPNLIEELNKSRRYDLQLIAWLDSESKKHGFKALLSNFKQNGNNPPSITSKLEWNKYVQANLKFLNKYYKEALVIAGKPYPESYLDMKALDASIQNGVFGKPALLMFASGLAEMIKNEQIILVRTQVYRIAASIMAFRALHGSFPATLEQAMAGMPASVFSMQNIKYSHIGEGFQLSGSVQRYPGSLLIRYSYPEPKN